MLNVATYFNNLVSLSACVCECWRMQVTQGVLVGRGRGSGTQSSGGVWKGHPFEGLQLFSGLFQ